MLRFTVALLIACTLQVWPVPASAEMRQFANIVYELPKGWRAGGKSDGRLELRHDDDHCRNCRILPDPGVEGGGPVAAWRDAMATPGQDMKVRGSPQQTGRAPCREKEVSKVRSRWSRYH